PPAGYTKFPHNPPATGGVSMTFTTAPRLTKSNRLWQRLGIATNWPVLAAVAVLATLGLISIGACPDASAAKQGAFLLVAVAGMALFQAVDYRRIGRWAWHFYIFAFLLILYTVIGSRIGLPGASRTKGAAAWISFGPIKLEPAELMKVAMILVLARYLRFRTSFRSFHGLLPPLLLALGPMAMILAQPDLGMAVLLLPIWFAMLFVAGAKVRNLLSLSGGGLLLGSVVWFCGVPGVPLLHHLPHVITDNQRRRVSAFFNSDNPSEQRSGNYQIRKALTAMGSGGITGKGFQNIPFGKTVPEAQNDMIFSLIGEQFGFIGSVAVLGAYMVLFAAGIEIAAHTREPFGRLVAVGIVAALAAQTCINLLVCTGLMPVTGITLPFVSSGGSSLVSSFLAAGLLLNVGQNRPLVMARESFQFA
ncbi:MAG TPA: FtsW/RodA/SpoVE family cell cycle protein, partial [Tepidisphaeraceae bacterium]|nr:FtsW/RodA/SpoVE family cell cycle protein [Tepidisphaeraceae bacterium]